MKYLMHYVYILRQQRFPIRFIISRIMMRSGLSRLVTIHTQTYKMKFHPCGVAAMKWVERAERDEETLARRYLKSGDTVLDVGANVGSFVLTAASIIAPSVIYAFEPHPRIYRYLVENIELNGLFNVRAINRAAGSINGNIGFTDSKSDVLNRVSRDGEISVLVTTLDEEFKSISGNIALMKIDVEGYEIEVLKGATDLLSRCECLLLEACSSHQTLFGYNTSDLVALLSPLGFSVFGFDLILNEIYCFDRQEVPARFEDILFVRNVDDLLRRTGFRLQESNNEKIAKCR